MSVVSFNSQAFLARYPEFNTLNVDLLAQYFVEAGMYCRNDGYGPISDTAILSMLLNMLTAHIAALNSGVNGQSAPQTVGRISSAGEGSVNVSMEMKWENGAAWYMQTKYGAAYWQASLPYRLGGDFVLDPSAILPPTAFGGDSWRQ
jgi:hypothetical protein